jgi:hypothetical protein
VQKFGVNDVVARPSNRLLNKLRELLASLGQGNQVLRDQYPTYISSKLYYEHLPLYTRCIPAVGQTILKTVEMGGRVSTG